MSAWDEISEQLKVVNTTTFISGRSRDHEHNKAMTLIRSSFLDLERKAAERDELRNLLLAEGIQNARLAVELEQARIIRDLTPEPTPIPPTHPKAMNTRAEEQA